MRLCEWCKTEKVVGTQEYCSAKCYHRYWNRLKAFGDKHRLESMRKEFIRDKGWISESEFYMLYPQLLKGEGI